MVLLIKLVDLFGFLLDDLLIENDEQRGENEENQEDRTERADTERGEDARYRT